MPKFTVIIPIYNVEKYINKCIDSVLRQNFKDFELILVDDGSPDECPTICNDYATNDSRIKVIHKKNGGLVSARNAGLTEATGEYTLYLDGDDWLTEDALSTINQKVLTNYDPDMIVFNMTRVTSEGKSKDPCEVQDGYYDEERLKKEIYPYMMYDNRRSFYHWLLFPSCGGKVIRTSILKSHNCKDERIRMGEDNAFIFECMLFSNSVYFMTDYFYMYNQLNSGSMRHNYDPDRFYNNYILINYMQEHLVGLNSEVDHQFNVFKAYWLIMAIFHEVKCNQPLRMSSKHIKKEIEKYNFINNIEYNTLPIEAKIFLVPIKMKWYSGALIETKLVMALRKNKDRG